MAYYTPKDDKPSLKSPNNHNYLIPFILVTSLFFLWGLANSLNGTLVKQFQVALDLQRWQANIVETAFYMGYFVMALPAGFVMKKYGYKSGILLGLLLYALGAFLFYPAASVREYSFFLFALFMIASGIAFLETAANLYVTVLGDPKKGDFRLNLAQSFNGLSTILGPVIGGFFIFSEKEYTKEILKNKHLVLGIIAQFLNVGAQVSIWGNFVDIKLDLAKNSNLWIVNEIYQVTESMSATQIASFHASFAFLLFMVGRFVGTYFMGKYASNKVLGIYSIGAVISMVIAILGGGIWAIFALMMVYFFQSIMFPTIFALACKDLGEGSKLASSLIIMSIVGGAIVPPITAFLFKTGTAVALCIPLFCFVFIVYYAFKGFQIQQESR
jgi:FHS family L-fucose permease-like MFS transporter